MPEGSRCHLCHIHDHASPSSLLRTNPLRSSGENAHSHDHHHRNGHHHNHHNHHNYHGHHNHHGHSHGHHSSSREISTSRNRDQDQVRSSALARLSEHSHSLAGSRAGSRNSTLSRVHEQPFFAPDPDVTAPATAAAAAAASRRKGSRGSSIRSREYGDNVFDDPISINPDIEVDRRSGKRSRHSSNRSRSRDRSRERDFAVVTTHHTPPERRSSIGSRHRESIGHINHEPDILTSALPRVHSDSRSSTLSRAGRGADNLSKLGGSNLTLAQDTEQDYYVHVQRAKLKEESKDRFNLQTVVLIGCYTILFVVAIIVGVVLCQQNGLFGPVVGDQASATDLNEGRPNTKGAADDLTGRPGHHPGRPPRLRNGRRPNSNTNSPIDPDYVDVPFDVVDRSPVFEVPDTAVPNSVIGRTGWEGGRSISSRRPPFGGNSNQFDSQGNFAKPGVISSQGVPGPFDGPHGGADRNGQQGFGQGGHPRTGGTERIGQGQGGGAGVSNGGRGGGGGFGQGGDVRASGGGAGGASGQGDVRSNRGGIGGGGGLGQGGNAGTGGGGVEGFGQGNDGRLGGQGRGGGGGEFGTNGDGKQGGPGRRFGQLDVAKPGVSGGEIFGQEGTGKQGNPGGRFGQGVNGPNGAGVGPAQGGNSRPGGSGRGVGGGGGGGGEGGRGGGTGRPGGQGVTGTNGPGGTRFGPEGASGTDVSAGTGFGGQSPAGSRGPGGTGFGPGATGTSQPGGTGFGPGGVPRPGASGGTGIGPGVAGTRGPGSTGFGPGAAGTSQPGGTGFGPGGVSGTRASGGQGFGSGVAGTRGPGSTGFGPGAAGTSQPGGTEFGPGGAPGTGAARGAGFGPGVAGTSGPGGEPGAGASGGVGFGPGAAGTSGPRGAQGAGASGAAGFGPGAAGTSGPGGTGFGPRGTSGTGAARGTGFESGAAGTRGPGNTGFGPGAVGTSGTGGTGFGPGAVGTSGTGSTGFGPGQASGTGASGGFGQGNAGPDGSRGGFGQGNAVGFGGSGGNFGQGGNAGPGGSRGGSGFELGSANKPGEPARGNFGQRGTGGSLTQSAAGQGKTGSRHPGSLDGSGGFGQGNNPGNTGVGTGGTGTRGGGLGGTGQRAGNGGPAQGGFGLGGTGTRAPGLGTNRPGTIGHGDTGPRTTGQGGTGPRNTGAGGFTGSRAGSNGPGNFNSPTGERGNFQGAGNSQRNPFGTTGFRNTNSHTGHGALGPALAGQGGGGGQGGFTSPSGRRGTHFPTGSRNPNHPSGANGNVGPNGSGRLPGQSSSGVFSGPGGSNGPTGLNMRNGHTGFGSNGRNPDRGSSGLGNIKTQVRNLSSFNSNNNNNNINNNNRAAGTGPTARGGQRGNGSGSSSTPGRTDGVGDDTVLGFTGSGLRTGVDPLRTVGIPKPPELEEGSRSTIPLGRSLNGSRNRVQTLNSNTRPGQAGTQFLQGFKTSHGGNRNPGSGILNQGISNSTLNSAGHHPKGNGAQSLGSVGANGRATGATRGNPASTATGGTSSLPGVAHGGGHPDASPGVVKGLGGLFDLAPHVQDSFAGSNPGLAAGNNAPGSSGKGNNPSSSTRPGVGTVQGIPGRSGVVSSSSQGGNGRVGDGIGGTPSEGAPSHNWDSAKHSAGGSTKPASHNWDSTKHTGAAAGGSKHAGHGGAHHPHGDDPAPGHQGHSKDDASLAGHPLASILSSLTGKDALPTAFRHGGEAQGNPSSGQTASSGTHGPSESVLHLDCSQLKRLPNEGKSVALCRPTLRKKESPEQASGSTHLSRRFSSESGAGANRGGPNKRLSITIHHNKTLDAAANTKIVNAGVTSSRDLRFIQGSLESSAKLVENPRTSSRSKPKQPRSSSSVSQAREHVQIRRTSPFNSQDNRNSSKVVRSWSHMDNAGTLSRGQVRSDGSFSFTNCNPKDAC